MTRPTSIQIQARTSDHDHIRWLERANLANFRGRRCLDLGCGSGYLTERQVQEGASLAVGIDVVPVDYKGHRDVDHSGPFFLSADLNSASWLPSGFLDGQIQGFDLITAFDIIEHLDSPWLFLKACSKLLSKSGHLVLTTPNANSWERWLRPRGWSGVQDPQHKILFTPYTLEHVLAQSGFAAMALKAPIRKLGWFSNVVGPIGGQLLAVSGPGAP